MDDHVLRCYPCALTRICSVRRYAERPAERSKPTGVEEDGNSRTKKTGASEKVRCGARVGYARTAAVF